MYFESLNVVVLLVEIIFYLLLNHYLLCLSMMFCLQFCECILLWNIYCKMITASLINVSCLIILGKGLHFTEEAIKQEYNVKIKQ